VVVLDGLGAHRTNRVRELIEERGAELLFLPSYSPDLNPIEEAFSKIKNIVRKAGARTREALDEVIMGEALSRRLRLKTWRDGSRTVAISHGINAHEHRCEKPCPKGADGPSVVHFR
jgi:transposase